MTTPPRPVEFRVRSLDLVPASLRPFYHEVRHDGRTFYELDVRGDATPPPPPPADEPERTGAPVPPFTPSTAAEVAREKHVQAIVATIAPLPEHANAVAKFVRDRIRTERDGSFTYLDAELARRGTPLPDLTGTPGLTSAARPGATIAYARAIASQHPDWLRPDVPPPPSDAERRETEVEPLPPLPPKNVSIPRGSDFETFEAAHELASSRGGQVVFTEPPAGPTEQPSFDGGKQSRMPIRRDLPFAEKEKIMRDALANGIDVEFVGDPVVVMRDRNGRRREASGDSIPLMESRGWVRES